MISFIEEDGHWLIDACYVKLKKNKLIIFFIVPRLGFFGSCFSFGLVFLRCCSCYSESFFFGQGVIYVLKSLFLGNFFLWVKVYIGEGLMPLIGFVD